MNQRSIVTRFHFRFVLVALFSTGIFWNAAASTNPVKLVDGVVLPKRPVADALADAMQFLRKADGNYVPGKIDGELAGYFDSAYVMPDGSRSDRKLSFPARHHAYFIFTFLRWGDYSGEKEWAVRARDLADWNLAHSTPKNAVYPNVPYSTYSNGKPGGSKDVDAIEPDKCAFIGSAYIALFEATKDKKYLEAARAIAETLVRHQNKDGSWPFRVVPEDGKIRQEFGGAPVFFVEFFESLLRHDKKNSYRTAHERSLKLMLDRNVVKNLWGTYHEDIVKKPDEYLSAEPMSFTAAYLFRNGKKNPEYIKMGRDVISRMEARLVHTKDHAAAPAPTVSEQAGFDHIMPGHTARYCMALAELFKVTGDAEAKKKAISAVNALTYMQSDAGLFRTYFHSVNESARGKQRPDWYSQHLYTVCHVLELMPIIPEAVPGRAPAQAAKPATPLVKVVDGIVQPKRPVTEAVADAMDFLKKADNDYVPGTKRDWAAAKFDELAGYFTTAWVLEDGSRAPRQQAFPGRQHAYFIHTFLNYHKFTGKKEWLDRARDLAEWNLTHSTPKDAKYSNLPYSVFTSGKGGGSAGKDSMEIDKSAYLGSAYITLFEVTNDKRYLEGARQIAETLVRRQNKDGSWSFRVVPETGEVREELGGAPVFFVEFFENLMRHEKKDSYQKARDMALQLMIDRNVKKNLWGIYHEDIRKKRVDALSAEPICFTAIYLFRNAKKNPEYIEMGRSLLDRMEKRLVHTTGHAAAPAPAVSEQEGFEHMMPGHTARYCLALLEMHNATGDKEAKKKTLSGINALTFMQSEEGLFKTHFQLVKERKPDKKRPNWYSQHLYTVCHVLEAMPSLPEIRGNAQAAK